MNQTKPNLSVVNFDRFRFKVVPESRALNSRWRTLLIKREISLIFYFCFITSQKWAKSLTAAYKAMNSFTYIPIFVCELFFQPMSAEYANLAWFDKTNSHLSHPHWNHRTKLRQLVLGWSLGCPLSNICPIVVSSIQNGGLY